MGLPDFPSPFIFIPESRTKEDNIKEADGLLQSLFETLAKLQLEFELKRDPKANDFRHMKMTIIQLKGIIDDLSTSLEHKD